MINEEHTLMDFDYMSDMLSHGSHKMVWRVCEVCGKEDAIPYYSYVRGYTRCSSCALIGINPSDETKRKMSKNHADISGKKNPFYGKHHSEETKRKISKNHVGMEGKYHSDETKRKLSELMSGINHPMYGKHPSNETRQKMSMSAQGVDEESWNGYITETLYPIEFTQLLRKEIRISTNDCDFLTGEHKDICNNGNELDVHHIDYDKQNCNIENLIPLSKSNHSKTNVNRIFWTRLFTNMQNTRYLLLELDVKKI